MYLNVLYQLSCKLYFPESPSLCGSKIELAKKGTCIRLEARNEANTFMFGMNLGIEHLYSRPEWSNKIQFIFTLLPTLVRFLPKC